MTPAEANLKVLNFALDALFNPKLGKFNVTSKGGLVTRTFFDARIAQRLKP